MQALHQYHTDSSALKTKTNLPSKSLTMYEHLRQHHVSKRSILLNKYRLPPISLASYALINVICNMHNCLLGASCVASYRHTIQRGYIRVHVWQISFDVRHQFRRVTWCFHNTKRNVNWYIYIFVQDVTSILSCLVVCVISISTVSFGPRFLPSLKSH